MSRTDFTLVYDGPALANHEMNVRDLAPALLGVGELFESLNRLFNGKEADVAVNVTAVSPGCFQVGFEIVQTIRDATEFLAGTEITAALNLKALVGFGAAGGLGLIALVRKLRGQPPERVEKLTPGMFRITFEGQTFDVPMELLHAYQELAVRRALERIISKPLQKQGIDTIRVEEEGIVVESISKIEEVIFRAPELPTDVIIEDERRAAYSIRELSFDEDGLWKLYDGSNPIKAKIEDPNFLALVENDDIRFAKHDVLVCLVHFVQRRGPKGGLANEYTVKEVLQHIAAPRQLRFPEPEDKPDDDIQEGG